MDQGGFLLGMLLVLVIALPVGLLIGAVLLRAGISLYNKFAGGLDSPSAVPEPPLLKSMGIVLLIGIVNWVTGVVIGFALGTGVGAAAGGNPDAAGFAMITAQLVSFAVGIPIEGGILSLMLPTTFTRGILVALCHMLVVFLIGIVLFAVIFGVMAAVGGFAR
jgi:hypothetical protein